MVVARISPISMNACWLWRTRKLAIASGESVWMSVRPDSDHGT
jgi:hypothetical protein